jgi:uncharacterized protein
MSDTQTLTLSSLHVYPIKSCGGCDVNEALLIETGLEFDRAWMVVDADGEMVTQRELPRMALIETQLRQSDLKVKAPGMLALHLAFDQVEAATRATVWGDEVKAYDMGDLAAQWFSDFLGKKLRLVRFDPDQKRLSDKSWTGNIDAENQFSDGFPLLVVSKASLAELNRRLEAAGATAAEMARFRPNIVIDGPGIEANGEDHLDEIRVASPEGEVVLKMVKPCSRCSIPDVNPATGEMGHAVSDALQAYRAGERGVSFGMNAVIVKGIECGLRRGDEASATLRF